MELKRITWDYREPPEDDLWRAGRLAEFFPFVAEDLDEEDKALILRYLDQKELRPGSRPARKIANGALKTRSGAD